ncbi:MAG: NADH-quinone oxidoreductase subunit C [Candidatus Omnitrophota bacterium]
MIKDEVKNALKETIKEWETKSPKRIYLTIDKKHLLQTAKLFFSDLSMRLSTITGIDNEQNFELIYHFSCDKSGEIFNIRVFLEKNNPEIDSLTKLFRASDWVEREINEMLGVRFIGHPNLTHLLLDNDWPKDSYPLRKDYTNE